MARDIVDGDRCGSFYQIREIYGLRTRVVHSQTYTQVTVDRMLLDLLVETSLHGQVEDENETGGQRRHLLILSFDCRRFR